jgi:four helix bundle protein
MGTFKELTVYKKAFAVALDIQNVTKRFPKEEQYALTDQIRRSSRSVCVNMAEGFRKVRYKAYFISKITDADMENTETQVWLDFGFAFGLLDEREHLELYRRTEEVGRMLQHIIDNPEKYGTKEN